jgi:hypothetical protein
MDTSKSSEQATRYLAGVSIFSGRPDPTWAVTENVAERLEALWTSLEKSTQEQQPPSPPPLGYRGCFLKDAAEGLEWSAYKGLVMLKSRTGVEARHDESRRFESTLLESAPEGLIPHEVLENEGL